MSDGSFRLEDFIMDCFAVINCGLFWIVLWVYVEGDPLGLFCSGKESSTKYSLLTALISNGFFQSSMETLRGLIWIRVWHLIIFSS